jgi:hypothetical protein
MKTDLLRVIVGGVVLMALVVLASMIALGHVEEKNSYGLSAIIAILGKFGLDFSEWCFSRQGGQPTPPPEQPPRPPSTNT